MHRNWIGIRVSAGLAILGSVATLALGGFMLFVTLVARPQPPDGTTPPFPMAVVGVVMAGLCAGLSGWGIWTGIGIFLRRGWARISIVVFAVLLTILGAGSALTILLIQIPTPDGLTQGRMDTTRVAIAGFYAVLVAIGVWWLVLFNLRSSKEYFAQSAPSEPGGRPLSVSVIGWYLLLSSLFVAAGAAMRVPAFVFGTVLTGWGGSAVYAVFAGAQILLGTGLLRLDERARMGAIGYSCLIALNAVLTVASPGLDAEMQIMRREMPGLFPAGTAVQFPLPSWLFVLNGIIFAAMPIWFLVRQRGAFVKAGTESGTGAEV